MDTRDLDSLLSTVQALSQAMGLEGGFSGRDTIRQEIKTALEQRPLSKEQKDILKAAEPQKSAKIPNIAGMAFGMNAHTDMTWEDVAHNLTDGISKRISNIDMALDMGIEDADDARVLYQNSVQLRNMAAELPQQITTILQCDKDNTPEFLSKIIDHIHGDFLPTIETHIERIEQSYGKMDVEPWPTSGSEYFKPFDIQKFKAASDIKSTATSRQHDLGSATPERPSRK